MEVVSFIVGAGTVLISILVGYFFGKGKVPEDIAGAIKKTITRPEGAVLRDEQEVEQERLRAGWNEARRKNPLVPPPKDLILNEDEEMST